MIYLDNNATTPLSPLVASHMQDLMHMRLANPSSQHAAGRLARKYVEHARDSILALCGGRTHGMASDQVLFTSGGTESNNLALLGMAEGRKGAIVVSAIEHPSVLAAAEYASMHGREVRFLPCDSQGVVLLDQLQHWVANHAQDPIAVVSIMAANNETGVIQPVEQAAKLCRAANVLIHTDAVQVLGKSSLSFAKLDVDAMTVTAHKLHGPTGIGALVVRHGVTVSPRSFGGFQQLGLRPGTESPVLASGFEKAVSLVVDALDQRVEVMQSRRDMLERMLIETFPACLVLGREVSRLPHTLSVAFPGVDRQALQLALDMSGIACSTGSACASGSSQPSHVLQAMGLPAEVVRGGIRFSVSAETEVSELQQTVDALQRILPRLS